jgi:hypothetical protein
MVSNHWLLLFEEDGELGFLQVPAPCGSGSTTLPESSENYHIFTEYLYNG